MTDAAAQIRRASRRAKSDVANKLVSMFLHELSRKISENWQIGVDSSEYEALIREVFGNKCPYCGCILSLGDSVIEHLDGMNRYRVGLHVSGNVLVACRECNSEKRRDDSSKVLSLSEWGWASFLSHDGLRCDPLCRTCRYWKAKWPDDGERKRRLDESLCRIRSFRDRFPEFERSRAQITAALPALLTKLYSDCQVFAETEIRRLLQSFGAATPVPPRE